jgi:hypothetical protein
MRKDLKNSQVINFLVYLTVLLGITKDLRNLGDFQNEYFDSQNIPAKFVPLFSKFILADLSNRCYSLLIYNKSNYTGWFFFVLAIRYMPNYLSLCFI